jgi:hypothetical protein
MTLQTPTPPEPAIPAAPAAQAAPPPGGPPTAAEMLQAARAHRSELRNTLDRVEEQRDDLQSELTQTPQSETAIRAGLEARLRELDTRILALDKEIATADGRVAQAAAVPGATYEPPPTIIRRDGPPEEVFVMGGMAIFFIGFPIAIAYARRLWKRAATVVSTEMPAEMTDRLNRMEQAIDAVAVELERVGEGQRYVTKVFTEQQRVLGAGAAEPLDVRQREALHQSRP